MYDRLSLIEKQYQEIQDKLSSGRLEVKEMTSLLKESSSIQETVETYRFFKAKSEELKDLEVMIVDEQESDLIEMLQLEIDRLNEVLVKTEDKLKILLLPKDPNDDKNVIVDIKGAAGGDEGNIFAGDLFRMYSKYAESQGWKIEILDAMEGSMCGYTSIEFMVSGKQVYAFLKYESGTHRVQRVPLTESMGRIHTSTATVHVMPEAEEIELDIKWDDIRVDTYNSSGPGGQSVNTTDSAVRVTHEPTGLVVTCQDGKSQHENKASALRILKARLFDKIAQEKADKEGEERRSKIGTGDRSEKVRTYNYPQNRVTDHRIGFSILQLDRVMEGKLEPILDALIGEDLKRKLEGKEQ